MRCYGIVNFELEDGYEAGFAEFLVIFGAEDHCAVCVARLAEGWRHSVG